MLKQHAAPTTLSEAIRYFADADTAIAFVVQLRWPSGVTCIHCGADRVSYLTTRRIFKCLTMGCRKQFSVKVGTIFEDSPLGLDKWLPALWLLANAKNGISSYELHRSLGVTQKTAWFMLSRIRLAMQTKSFAKFSGTVEADETFIGGKTKNMHKSKRAKLPKHTGHQHMEMVMGLLERKRGEQHSTVRLSHNVKASKPVVQGNVRVNVEEGSNIFTDSLRTYTELGRFEWKDKFNHAAVDHAIRYVDGQVHTNGLENFWSLLKRSIKGTYVSVDAFHLFRYLDEQAYRFNNRTLSDLERFVGVLKDVVSKRLTYAELISADLTPART